MVNSVGRGGRGDSVIGIGVELSGVSLLQRQKYNMF